MHKWRVNDSALAKSLVTNGGKLVADYDGFQLIEADDTALANLDASRVELEDEFDAIKLNAGQLDTRAAEIYPHPTRPIHYAHLWCRATALSASCN